MHMLQSDLCCGFLVPTMPCLQDLWLHTQRHKYVLCMIDGQQLQSGLNVEQTPAAEKEPTGEGAGVLGVESGAHGV